jgi:hypothetical protein
MEQEVRKGTYRQQVHSTPHLELLSGNNLPEEGITVVMGNGNEEKVTTIGTVKGNEIKKWKPPRFY